MCVCVVSVVPVALSALSLVRGKPIDVGFSMCGGPTLLDPTILHTTPYISRLSRACHVMFLAQSKKAEMREQVKLYF